MTVLTLEGVHNFRDLGGLTTKDGKKVKQGLLFRGGHLGALTNEDQKKLKDWNVQLVIDYRDLEELEKHPAPQLEDVEIIRVSAKREDSVLKSASVDRLMTMEFVESFKDDLFLNFYLELPFNNPAYQELFNRLKQKNVPLIHHCTAGKDRTGVATALIYLLLGVEEEQIIEEYLLTNDYVKDNPPQWLLKVQEILQDKHQNILSLAYCDRIWIEAIFKEIQSTFGSYENYFAEEYGLTKEDIEELRAYYLE